MGGGPSPSPSPSTQYQDQSGQSGCKGCAQGYYRSSSSRQTQCQAGFRCPGNCARAACGAGTYQDQVGQTGCKSW